MHLHKTVYLNFILIYSIYKEFLQNNTIFSVTIFSFNYSILYRLSDMLNYSLTSVPCFFVWTGISFSINITTILPFSLTLLGTLEKGWYTSGAYQAHLHKPWVDVLAG